MVDEWTELARKIAEMFGYEEYPDFKRRYGDPIREVAALLRTQLGERWIPVGERLPELEGDYEIWSNGSSDNAPGVYAPFHFWKQCGKFREDVTHWRPRPAPPADGGSVALKGNEVAEGKG